MFENCSVYGKKIGFFRKLKGDTSCTGMIPSNQFCSDACYLKGLDMVEATLKHKKNKSSLFGKKANLEE